MQVQVKAPYDGSDEERAAQRHALEEAAADRARRLREQMLRHAAQPRAALAPRGEQ